MRDLRTRIDAAAVAIRTAASDLATDWIEPPVLQPSDVYLELVGEDLRARAFLLEGDDALCVRPDMTVPAVRYALAHGAWKDPFGVGYDGVVFRRRDTTHDDGEFRQVGAERFANGGALEELEASLLAAAVESCHALQFTPRVKLGDIGLFEAFVDAVALPERWARRIKRAFSRPGGLAMALKQAMDAVETPPSKTDHALARALARMDEGDAEGVVADVLSDARIAVVGTRTIEEIARRLRAKGAADDAAPRRAQVQAIADAVTLSGSPDKTLKALEAIARRADVSHPTKALEAIARARARCAKINLGEAEFSVGFGGGLAYYDGFVFELEAPALGARASLGGGGRYDNLLKRLAHKESAGPDRFDGWSAMGFALRPERLAEACT